MKFKFYELIILLIKKGILWNLKEAKQKRTF